MTKSKMNGPITQIVLGSLGVALAVALPPEVAFAESLEELLVQKGVISRSEVAAAPADAAKIYWHGGTRFEFPDSAFTSQINLQLQTRYTFLDQEQAADTSSFEFRRVRLIFQGSALHEEFNYFLQTDFVGKTVDNTKTPDLRDAWIQWNPIKAVGVRMGQAKLFISRQENNSSSKLQFPERTLVSNLFELGRQGGISSRWTSEDGNLTAAAGIWNGESTGEGRNKPGVDTRETGAATIRWTALGKMDAMEEGDISHTEDPALNFGAAYAYGRFQDSADTYDKSDLSVDANFKYQGASVHAEYFWSSVDGDNTSEVSPMGFYVQGGYFLMPQKFELVARYGLIDCDDGQASEAICSGNDQVHQASIGANYFFWKHNLKAQLSYDWINQQPIGDAADDKTTNRIIFQLSSYF